MSEKISEYITSVTALASGDLMDVSKLISTSPDVYQSQKLNYSVLLTELNNDLGFIDGSGTTNKISKFTASGTIGDSSISDDGTNVSTLQAVGIGIATPTSKLHIVGDAATQTTASLLIKNSIGGELIKLLNDGSSLIGINTFAVTDGNAFNNSLGFYTNGTVLKARYKNNAGISSDLVISSNLGSENLTSADDARTFTLKTGTTATQNFQIKNSAGIIGYYFDGTGSVAIGTTTTSGKFTVKGAGASSLTKTAVFQNSASSKALEIFDSLGINFGSNTLTGGEGYAFGVGNTVNTNTAFTSGYLNNVNGYYAAAFGRENAITSYCFSAGGWNNITNSGSFALGFYNTVSSQFSLSVGESNSISGTGSFVYGQNNANTSNHSMSGGLYTRTTGINSVALGLGHHPATTRALTAGGIASFIFSAKNASAADDTGAMANYSFILGGLNHSVVAGATSSGIIGGESNIVNASVLRSVILGGTGITATENDTAYAVNLNASGITKTPQVVNTPKTITVTANAGTVTRANRTNNFTNSSAAAMTITMSTTGALDGDMVQVRIYDFSAAAQTITWVNTENSTITVPTTSNGSTTLPLTVGFQYNSATSKWRCIGSV